MHEKLEAHEELLSKSLLDNYYAAFRQPFGPEVLQALEGKPCSKRSINAVGRETASCTNFSSRTTKSSHQGSTAFPVAAP